MVKRFASFLAVCLVASVASRGALAQVWPAKPLRWIVPIAAGGTTDVATRLLAAGVSQALGQPVLVENRPGAATIIGTEVVAKAAPDGYTLLSVDNALVLNTALYQKLPYDPERDLDPVALYGRVPLMITVRASLPAKNIAELIALAKDDPGRITFGSAGKGSPHHLLQELFKQRTGTEFTHVPYKGGSPAVAELVAGRLDISVTNWGSVAGHVDAGRLRVLAVSAAQRSPRQPQIPTIKEVGGPEMDVVAWQGVLVPKGTPKAIIDRLNTEIVAVLRLQKATDALGEAGIHTAPSTPAEFAALLKSERSLWEPLIRSWKITLD